MKFGPKAFLLLLMLAGAALLSACGANPSLGYSWPGLNVQGETAYMSAGLYVNAIDLNTGGRTWQYPVKSERATDVYFAAPQLTPDGTQLIIGGYDHKIHSVNPANGQLIWKFEQAANTYVAAPLVTDKGIFAPNSDGTLYALDLTGKLIWKFTSPSPLWASPVSDSDCGCIYLPAMDHHLYALNAETGAQLWKTEDLGGAMVSQPSYDPAGTLYVGTFASEVLALDAQTGGVRWRFATDAWIWSAITLADDQLYFGDLKGNLYALDATDGHQLWKIATEAGAIVSAPAVTDQNIYVTGEKSTLFVFDLAGGQAWSQPLKGKLYAAVQPVLLPDGLTILVAPNESENQLIALTSAGAQKWALTPQK